jgi:hypothetical protein
LAPHKLSLHLVTYPPHAVTSPSLMNLGPVARLELTNKFPNQTNGKGDWQEELRNEW